MRVISGEYGGRRLKAVSGMNTRPTTDKVKESIFNMIGPYFKGGRVLDLYSGSGSLGIEAVSRGMDEAVLVDTDNKAIKTIRENIEMTKEPSKFKTYKSNSFQAIKELAKEVNKFDLVLLDPPYEKQEILKDIERLIDFDLLNPRALIVCETDARTLLSENIQHVLIWKEKQYGTTKVTIYEAGGNS